MHTFQRGKLLQSTVIRGLDTRSEHDARILRQYLFRRSAAEPFQIRALQSYHQTRIRAELSYT